MGVRAERSLLASPKSRAVMAKSPIVGPKLAGLHPTLEHQDSVSPTNSSQAASEWAFLISLGVVSLLNYQSWALSGMDDTGSVVLSVTLVERDEC